jgi:hypothetical protein
MFYHCEDPNRTDPPEEYRPITRFLDRLTEPEDRYVDRPDDYLPMTDREIEAAKEQAKENNRVLAIALANIEKQHNKGRHRTK